MNERMQRLEEKIAYLERHVTEQDRAMLEFAEELDRLKKEMAALRERPQPSGAGDPNEPPGDERPPHY